MDKENLDAYDFNEWFESNPFREIDYQNYAFIIVVNIKYATKKKQVLTLYSKKLGGRWFDDFDILMTLLNTRYKDYGWTRREKGERKLERFYMHLTRTIKN